MHLMLDTFLDKQAVSLGIPGIKSAGDGESFTAIWERDLASRFGQHGLCTSRSASAAAREDD